MAVTQTANGTQTAVIDTVHTLTTQTTAAVYQLFVNLSNLVNGEVVTITIEDKVLTGSTSAVLFEQTFAHVQAEPVFASPAFMVAHQIICKLEQTDGTGRDFEWSLRTV